MSLHYLVTGGSGYIGEAFIALALADGNQVTTLGRNINLKTRNIEWALGNTISNKIIYSNNKYPKVDVVVHLAHDWEDDTDTNLFGTMKLLEWARRNQVKKFLFVSSFSANKNALNNYGRIKWNIEQQLLSPNEVSVRLGLVYGGSEKGIWGNINKLVKNFPILPMVDPWRPIQPIHVDDACQALLKLSAIQNNQLPVYMIGDSVSVPFGIFLKNLRELRYGKILLIIPLPSKLLALVFIIFDRIPNIPKTYKERFYGLKGTRYISSKKSLKAAGISLRKLDSGIADESVFSRRRRLIQEGHAILLYLLEMPPKLSHVKKFVREVEASSCPRPIHFLKIFLFMPTLLRFIEPLHRNKGVSLVEKRLHLATILQETSSQGLGKFFQYQPLPIMTVIIKLFLLLIVEAILLPTRILFGRWLVR